MKRLLLQIAMLAAVVLLFVGFNASVYVLLTRRLSNNFSDTSQAKMVDVAAFLPFEDGSDLAHIETDFFMDGDLPVLDAYIGPTGGGKGAVCYGAARDDGMEHFFTISFHFTMQYSINY